ncbi:MAG TPA: UDP-glucose/GDP-mannose dehydrogenase family protein [Candidatus Eremiobacteraceae bacterium]|nr:UDP-glucose/GDP-mannose dehydrogenase family protein [Candidatus Eremiobacteraceae bacterium]
MGLSISVFGMGYVGSVTAACFAHVGHRVTGVDVSPAKVEMMASGRSPIIEARMSELVAEGHRAGMLHATTDAVGAVRGSEISFVCVGTPSLRSGKPDLGYVERVVHEIGAALKQKDSYHVVVLRSTVLPGTTESLVIPTLEKASGHRAGADFAVCYNPEFMREGSAVADFLQPPYTVFGAQDPKHLAVVRQLYGTIANPVFETSIPVAEMVKYVCNAFHALKVSFANEVGTLCKSLGVDADAVTKIYTSDTKLNISPAYLSPGFAFGGSCLPKDLRALGHRAREFDLALPLLESILPSNAQHIDRAVDAVLRTNKKKISFLGLSFKPGTDDLRESPQVQMIKRLLGEGSQVRVWDRDVSLGQLAGSNRQYIEEVIPHIGSLLSANLEEVVRSGEVVVIATKVDKDQLARCLGRDQIVIDLVNLASASQLSTAASYQGICW